MKQLFGGVAVGDASIRTIKTRRGEDMELCVIRIQTVPTIDESDHSSNTIDAPETVAEIAIFDSDPVNFRTASHITDGEFVRVVANDVTNDGKYNRYRVSRITHSLIDDNPLFKAPVITTLASAPEDANVSEDDI